MVGNYISYWGKNIFPRAFKFHWRSMVKSWYTLEREQSWWFVIIPKVMHWLLAYVTQFKNSWFNCSAKVVCSLALSLPIHLWVTSKVLALRTLLEHSLSMLSVLLFSGGIVLANGRDLANKIMERGFQTCYKLPHLYSVWRPSFP